MRTSPWPSLDPTGHEVIVVDRPIGTVGTERVSLLAVQPGAYRLEIRNPGGEGHYRLRVVDGPRPARPADHRRAEAEALFMDGRRSEKRSPPDDAGAAESFRRGAELAAAATDRQLEAISLARLGDCLYRLDEVERAVEVFGQALPMLDAAGEPSSAAEIHNTLGVVERGRGRFAEALAHYAEAERLGAFAGNEQARIQALGNRGIVEMYQGEIEQALEAFRDQREGWRRLGLARGEVDALNRIGELYAEVGEPQLALDFLAEAVTLARREGYRLGGANAFEREARAHLLRGELVEAQDLLERARSIIEDLDQPYALAGILNSLGRVYRLRGLFPQAIDALDRALTIYRRRDARRDIPVVLMHQAWVREGMGDTASALPLYDQARTGYLAASDPAGVASARYGAARAELRLDRLDAALEDVDLALQWVESQHRRLAVPSLATPYLASKQDYFALKIEILMRLDEREPAAGYAARALAVSEEARARALVESLLEARAGLRVGAEPQLIAERQALWRRIQGLEIAVAEARAGPPSSGGAELRVQLRDLLAEDDQIEARLRASNPRYAALTRPQPPSLAEIQGRLLDDDTLLLVYALGEERSHLWAIDRRGMTCVKLPGREILEPEARRAYDLLVRSRELRAAGPLRDALRELSDRLLGPLAGRPDTERLVIVADGALHYIPFGALPEPARAEGGGEPLVARREVVNLPSLTVLAELRKTVATRPSPDLQVAVVADPVYASNDQRLSPGQPSPPQPLLPDTELAALAADLGIESFQRLEHAHDEAKAILALAPPAERFEALDAKANLATIASAPLRRFRYLHFATHSVIDEKHPQLSGLVLSLFDPAGNPIEGILRLHDIYDLDLPVDLVVLSACSTALGEEVRGEGLINLTRGFMSAGAPRVVVSLWNVNDLATAQLMQRLYVGLLREGRSPAAALRAAQESIRRERGWDAPFYWAGFVLQGDWR